MKSCSKLLSSSEAAAAAESTTSISNVSHPFEKKRPLSPQPPAMASSSRSAGAKRLLKEYAELQAEPHTFYAAWPASDDNIFEWHFTIRGPEGTSFEEGAYHGRILLPPEYPFKPPSIIFLTPNGRFEVGKKICLSVTGHHPEFWRPAWGSESFGVLARGTGLTTLIGDMQFGPCSLPYFRLCRRRAMVPSGRWTILMRSGVPWPGDRAIGCALSARGGTLKFYRTLTKKRGRRTKGTAEPTS